MRKSWHVSLRVKAQKLKEQNNQCAYCDMGFTNEVPPVFDHFIPRTASGCTNRSENIVAACRSCNCRKSDKIFDTVNAVREYLGARLKRDKRCLHCFEFFYGDTHLAFCSRLCAQNNQLRRNRIRRMAYKRP